MPLTPSALPSTWTPDRRCRALSFTHHHRRTTTDEDLQCGRRGSRPPPDRGRARVRGGGVAGARAAEGRPAGATIRLAGDATLRPASTRRRLLSDLLDAAGSVSFTGNQSLIAVRICELEGAAV